jgi:hypothetical protein
MSASGFRQNGGPPLDDGAAAADPQLLCATSSVMVASRRLTKEIMNQRPDRSYCARQPGRQLLMSGRAVTLSRFNF